ncbi:MAG: hypothetical protein JW732_02145 [Dehalococcoidia bacterium]|nr:hypothetical protein [Dehalococcoidia bacterium]
MNFRFSREGDRMWLWCLVIRRLLVISLGELCLMKKEEGRRVLKTGKDGLRANWIE